MFKRLPFVALSAVFALTTAAYTQPDSETPAGALAQASEESWVTVDPQNLLVMELPSGPMIIEMRPDLAPKHVERMRTLTRQGFFDGVVFHRVIEGFMAQGGDPTATGQGGSDLPDLPGEFAHNASSIAGHVAIGRDERAAQIGFLGTVPIGTQPPTLSKVMVNDVYALWGLHCQGVMSMARANNPNSANSQFFLMFGDSRNALDQGYTVWGKVVNGIREARRINRGEPPARPTPIVRMRVMSDIPESEQKKVEYLDPSSETFASYLSLTGKVSKNGFVKDACGIDVPVRINGEITI